MIRLKIKRTESIYILSTAVCITFVMVIAMAYYALLAPVYPEWNRPRLMMASSAKYENIREDGSSTNCYMTTGAGFTYDFYRKYFLPMKTPKNVCCTSSTGERWEFTAGDKMAECIVNMVDDRFFRVFPMDVVAGEVLSEGDMAITGESAYIAAVINETTARKLFGNVDDAIGRELNNRFIFAPLRVKGVVRDVSPLAMHAYGDIFVPASYETNRSSINDILIETGYCVPVFVAKSKADFDAVREEFQGVARMASAEYKSRGVLMRILFDELKTHRQTVLETQNGEDNRLSWMVLTLFILFLVPAAYMTNMVAWRLDRRKEELGVSRAFGATRRALLWQLLRENLLTTCMGGALGLLLSWVVLLQCRSWLFASLGISDAGLYSLPLSVFFSPGVFAIAFAACIVLNLVAALLPARQSLRQNIVECLHGATAKRWSPSLVVALALVAWGAWHVVEPMAVYEYRKHGQPGYDPERYAVVQLFYDANLYEVKDFGTMTDVVCGSLSQLANAIRNIDGVEDASLAFPELLPGCCNWRNPRLSSPASDTTRFCSLHALAASPYNRMLSTLGITVVDGDLSIEEIEAKKYDANRNIVISRSAAIKLFGTEKAAGKKLRNMVEMADNRYQARDSVTVAAVLSDIASNLETNDPSYYFDYIEGYINLSMAVLVRMSPGVSAKEIEPAVQQIRSAGCQIQQVLPLTREQEKWDVRQHGELRSAQYVNRAMLAFLLFNVVVGVGSAFYVITRTRRDEIGVRRAFGAPRRRIVASFVGRGWLQALAGIAIGTALFFLLSGTEKFTYSLNEELQRQIVAMHNIDAGVDWVTTLWQHIAVVFSLITGLILAVVTLCTALPAWMATKEKPVAALKEE